jgi:hypothetical protein
VERHLIRALAIRSGPAAIRLVGQAAVPTRSAEEAVPIPSEVEEAVLIPSEAEEAVPIPSGVAELTLPWTILSAAQTHLAAERIAAQALQIS